MNKKLVLTILFWIIIFAEENLSGESANNVYDVAEIEEIRLNKNSRSKLSTDREGDRFVFDHGLNVLGDISNVQKGIEFIKSWSSPADPTGKNSYWRDVSFLYKYFAALKAKELMGNRVLPENFEKVIIPFERRSYETDFLNKIKQKNNGELPYFFQRSTKISLGKKLDISRAF